MREIMRSLILAGLASMLLMGCKESERTANLPTREFSLPVIDVQITDIPRVYTVPGSVVSDDRIQLSSRITGFIKDISVHEGEIVYKGDLLVQIDSADIEGKIGQVKAGLQAAQIELQDASQDVVKYEKLLTSRTVSAETLRKARVRRSIAEARHVEAQAALDAALSQRAYTAIKSPIEGVVVTRQKQSGDLATPGAPILTIESHQTLLFETYVAESQVIQIRPGNPLDLEIDALNGRAITGKVLRVVPSGDLVTRRYQVKIALPPLPAVLPGMFGRAHFVLGTDRALVVPREALVERGGLWGVFALNPRRQVHFRWLRTGREWPGRVEVTAGLEGGELILAHDDIRVRDGDMIVPGAKDSADE